MTKKQKKQLWRIILSTVIIAALVCFQHFYNGHPLSKDNWIYKTIITVIYLFSYLIAGGDVLKKAIKNIIKGQIFDENFLMAVATIGAILLALYKKDLDFNEAVAVMIFYKTGELFESIAVGKSRKNISALMDIRPDFANIIQDGNLVKVDPETIPTGSIIIVQPGEKVPLDGIVIEGNSTLNTSALTGESVPRKISENQEILSGCINLDGLLKIKTTKAFGESTVSKILQLMEESSSHKSKSENFISKFAKIYTPAVCLCALSLALLPPVFNLITKSPDGPDWSTWIYRSLIFLVISCPCALVISIPLTFFAGLGGASKKGILIKGSNYMETLAKINTIVFDKTGTLTEGVFKVQKINAVNINQTELIEIAAHAESNSTHPIAKSIIEAYTQSGKIIDLSKVSNIHEIAGKGITAIVDGKEVFCGNQKLMESLNINSIATDDCGTVIHVAVDKKYCGHLIIADGIKPSAKAAIKSLKSIGVNKTVMLTGDSESIAKKVASEISIDEYHAELLPQNKVEWVETLLASCKNGKLAFTGDGINDAPVLARSDLGIAMGALGSDAAIEAADVVLMDDDIQKISTGIKHSKKVLTIVWQNIFFALGIKFACLILGAMGIANMWLAIFADVGVMIIAVLNAIRALR